LIDVMESEYVLFARARGESLGQVVRRHGLRNIALPAVTLQCASVSELFGGSVLAERVFSYPGLGNTAVEAGLHADAPLLMGIALFSVLFVFAGNLTANVIYGVVDPQIREGERDHA
jgi:peptide/nickel transport system permease protein